MLRKSILILGVLVASVFVWPALAETELPVFNGNFEILPEGVEASEAFGKIPLGWAVWHPQEHDRFSVGLTDELVYEGRYAVKVVNDEATGLFITTKPFAIEPGKTYAALVHLYNASEPPLYQDVLHVYIEFWKDDGWWGSQDYWSEEAWQTQPRSPWNVGNRVAQVQLVPKGHNEWEEVFVMGTAPRDAQYMTISFWSAHRRLKTYIDDLRVAALD